MKTIEQWFSEYGESHQNLTNKRIHWVCVPAILFSIVGLLWAIDPLYAGLAIAISLLFYFSLSVPLSLAMIIVFCLSAAIAKSLGEYLLPTSTSIFVTAWIFQFIGHRSEGKKPSFFKDIQFLLIGPLWCLGFLFQKLNLRY